MYGDAVDGQPALGGERIGDIPAHSGCGVGEGAAPLHGDLDVDADAVAGDKGVDTGKFTARDAGQPAAVAMDTVGAEGGRSGDARHGTVPDGESPAKFRYRKGVGVSHGPGP